jgi:hypothetical protein
MNEKAYDLIEKNRLYRRRCSGGIYPDHVTGSRFDVYCHPDGDPVRQTYSELRDYSYYVGIAELDDFLALIPYEVK